LTTDIADHFVTQEPREINVLVTNTDNLPVNKILYIHTVD